jgi:hypothetical protein
VTGPLEPHLSDLMQLNSRSMLQRKMFFCHPWRKQMHKLMFGALAVAFLTAAAPATAQTGPVATACATDIPKFCAGKGHGNRQTRTCLESNREKLSAECRSALDGTRGGRR